MSPKHLLLCCAFLATAIFAGTSHAKDKPVSLSECPDAVQAVIKKYEEQGKLEEIGMDEKKKSGGPAVYEAKFSLNSGKRVEVHISTSGEILTIEEKKPKKQ